MKLGLVKKALLNPGKVWRYASREVLHEVSVLPYAATSLCRLTVGGKAVAFSTRDWYSKEWFFPRMDHGRYHEPAVTAIVEALAPTSPSFIDVGAHLGYFTVVSAALMPERPVLAFEIDDRAYERLERNVVLNEQKNVRLFHEAIADTSGTAEYHRPLRIDSGESLVAPGSTGTPVKAITLDEALHENHVSAGMVKIDVEGAEYGVLLGGKEMLTKGTVLLLEIHGQKLAKFGSNSRAVLELLESEGYETYEIAGHRRAETPTLKKLSSNDALLDRNVMTIVLRKNDALNRSALETAFGKELFTAFA